MNTRPTKTMSSSDTKALIVRGYCRVSRKFGIIARIDRPDWYEFLAKELRREPGECLGATWEDQYRRVYSKDVLVLNPPQLALNFPGSTGTAIGYQP